MKISVVIPCYNSAGHIGRCLDSVLAQALQPAEIICVNDGSTDNTLDILNDYKKKHASLISVIDQPNSGAGKARNSGVQRATGEFIQFLDADDELLRDKLLVQSGIAASASADLIVGSSIRVTGQVEEKTNAVSDDSWVNLIAGRLGNTCSNLFRKSSIMEVAGWNEELRSSQEADLMFRLLCNGAQVKYDLTINTRVHVRKRDSISAGDNSGNLERYIRLRYRIYEWLKQHDMLTAERKSSLMAVLLGSLRMLYRFDRSKAVKLHDSLYKPNFDVHSSVQNSSAYVFLYRTFGFAGAQRLLSLTGR